MDPLKHQPEYPENEWGLASDTMEVVCSSCFGPYGRRRGWPCDQYAHLMLDTDDYEWFIKHMGRFGSRFEAYVHTRSGFQEDLLEDD